MIVYITIGLPGSGKSSWARRKARDENTIIINRDALRCMIKGGLYTFDKKFESFIKDLIGDMMVGGMVEEFDMVIDECNIKKCSRREIIVHLKNYKHPEDDLKVIAVKFLRKDLKTNLYFRMLDCREICEEEWKQIIQGMIDAYEEVNWKEEGFDGYIEIDEDLNETNLEGEAKNATATD
jgi:tRNA uridine 5-carbamoylmethylation protein Kti12